MVSALNFCPCYFWCWRQPLADVSGFKLSILATFGYTIRVCCDISLTQENTIWRVVARQVLSSADTVCLFLKHHYCKEKIKTKILLCDNLECFRSISSRFTITATPAKMVKLNWIMSLLSIRWAPVPLMPGILRHKGLFCAPLSTQWRRLKCQQVVMQLVTVVKLNKVLGYNKLTSWHQSVLCRRGGIKIAISVFKRPAKAGLEKRQIFNIQEYRPDSSAMQGIAACAYILCALLVHSLEDCVLALTNSVCYCNKIWKLQKISKLVAGICERLFSDFVFEYSVTLFSIWFNRH